MEQVEHAGCNTSKPAKKRRAYMLTINNYTEDDIKAINETMDNDNVMDLIGQEEIGDNGTKHIQLYIRYKNPIAFNSVKKAFNRAHIEECRNIVKSAKYCMKEETRVNDGYQWSKINSASILKTMKDNGTMELEQMSVLIADDCANPMDGLTWHQWQTDLWNTLESEPDKRTIHWYYDSTGGTGKTTFAKYLMLERDDTILCTGSTRDSKYIVAQWMLANECKRSPKVIIYDIARCQDSEMVSYQTIEDMKNGLFLSTKYECKTVIYNCPHLIVFSNQEPRQGKLSKDRINLINMDKNNQQPICDN